ncbi:hypothetical protein ZWY2020_008373 [Hordeum vulgare]|nr:hypothetical protein ZWY2020_008373 [Hordeum vulgare]
MPWWKRSAHRPSSASASTPASPACASTSCIPCHDGAGDLPRSPGSAASRHVDDIEVGASALRLDDPHAAPPSSSSHPARGTRSGPARHRQLHADLEVAE